MNFIDRFYDADFMKYTFFLNKNKKTILYTQFLFQAIMKT